MRVRAARVRSLEQRPVIRPEAEAERRLAKPCGRRLEAVSLADLADDEADLFEGLQCPPDFGRGHVEDLDEPASSVEAPRRDREGLRSAAGARPFLGTSQLLRGNVR